MTSNWDEYNESSSSDDEEEEEIIHKSEEEKSDVDYKLAQSQYKHVSVMLDNIPPEEMNYKKNVNLLTDVDKTLLSEYKHKISYLNTRILQAVLRGDLNSATKLNYAHFLKHTLKQENIKIQ